MTESPAELLRRCVAKMLADSDRCGDPDGSFMRAVADLLAMAADHDDLPCPADAGDMGARALAVARAYLGEKEGEDRG